MEQKNKAHLEEFVRIVEKELAYRVQVTVETKPQERLIQAMQYSLMAGGKRIRPVLLLEFCTLCGGNLKDALPAACAIEMLHTFSLIHDDLPEMDNDDYRRGRLSCHKAFDNATALLAGDALFAQAYETLVSCPNQKPESMVRLVKEFSHAAGAAGMIGGQVLDMEFEDRSNVSQIELERMVAGKTVALIRVACRMGCILAGADEKRICLADNYAENLGLAFQVVDDVLDVIGTMEKLGKPIGSDADEGKTTFVTTLGLDGAQKLAASLTEKAMEAIKQFPNAAFLLDLTEELLSRQN
ncbi:MAG: polyprenyl synthetase family protein [Ruminococcus sp.]|nr:polyprenyl synthetase family protein [Ruminococcus sp.]